MDVTEHRLSGELCTTSRGKLIVHEGHLCEGANLTTIRDDNFCLWHRCVDADVPANTAYEGTIDDVTCPECLGKLKKEN